MTKSIIVGGGVIGLSIAYELSKRGQQVVLIEKDQVGRKASWAGAGIILPASQANAIHPQEQLEARSNQLHAQWAEELLAATGIDNGYRGCGGIYLARTAGELASLIGATEHWQQRQIKFEELSPTRLTEILPGIELNAIRKSVFVPSEAQIQNPVHLQALLAACLKNGVEIVEQIEAIKLEVDSHKTVAVGADGQSLTADNFCYACGPWTQELLQPFPVELPTIPVRGQMVLFKLSSQQFQPIVNEGSRYLVPRTDGHVLVGSTIEEVGFNTQTEPADVAELKSWAAGLIPECNEQAFVKSWAGLRPATYDGFPYLGRLGRSTNSFVATGHFKGGLHLSTASAEAMADLMCGKQPRIDLAPFSPSRADSHQSIEIK